MNDSTIYTYSDDSGKTIFSYRFVKEHRIEIQKWFDTSGDIIIPEFIPNNLYIRGIGHEAFELTESTLSIRIPSTIYRIKPDSFVYTGNAYHTPYIIIDEHLGCQSQLRIQLIELGWTDVYVSWGCRRLIRPGVTQSYTDSESGVDLVYRMLSPKEVEIVRWLSPRDIIHIPSEINSLQVTVLGCQSFAYIPEATEIYIPDSVKRIEDDAFYCEDEAEYIFGDLYDLGWSYSTKPQGICRLRLPSTVTISNADALYRRTWYRNRRCGDRYENNLIIATAQNAEVIRFLMEHNWCIVKESNDVAYLTYKDSKTDTFAKV